MRTTWKLACAMGVGAAATALFAGPASAAPATSGTDRPAAGGVVFVQNDDTAANTVLAYERTAAGGLTPVGSYPTGGRGGVLSGSVVDHLAAQGSLSFDRAAGLLYAVNAGSDTLTTFAVHGDQLVRRQVVGTGGQFPVSIAARGDAVYVLNARAGGSISGYLQFGGYLVPIPGWHRELHLDTSAPGQPNEFTSTPGQLGITPDGRDLLVSTKNGGNSVEAFPLGLFGPARTPTVTALPGTVPFGFTFDRTGDLVLTEAGPDAVATFRVGRGGALTQLASAPTGQAATCWVVGARHTVYASNAGSGTLSLFGVGRQGALTGEGTATTDPGTVDAAVSGDQRFLYVQTGKNGVVDAYRINADGTLTAAGSVTVPNGVGGEGIVAA